MPYQSESVRARYIQRPRNWYSVNTTVAMINQVRRFSREFPLQLNNRTILEEALTGYAQPIGPPFSVSIRFPAHDSFVYETSGKFGYHYRELQKQLSTCILLITSLHFGIAAYGGTSQHFGIEMIGGPTNEPVPEKVDYSELITDSFEGILKTCANLIREMAINALNRQIFEQVFKMSWTADESSEVEDKLVETDNRQQAIVHGPGH